MSDWGDEVEDMLRISLSQVYTYRGTVLQRRGASEMDDSAFTTSFSVICIMASMKTTRIVGGDL